MTSAQGLLTPAVGLKELLKSANYDAALELVLSWDVNAVLKGARPGLPQLQLACMISDVLDYGGQYPKAAATIREYGQDAKDRLTAVRSSADLGVEADYDKQSCWALMMWGMCYYRGLSGQTPDYQTAKKLFVLAKEVLQHIAAAGRRKCFGSLARAWYCIGLVERQDREYRAARGAFRRSIESAGRALDERPPQGLPLSFDFNLARCNGLGIGWIAYNGAHLNEAASALDVARRLMVSIHARFISAYIDVVHASVMVSEARDPGKILEAIRLLKEALNVFSPQKGFKHLSYALRAENELAHAYLRLAILGPNCEQGRCLKVAESYVDAVKAHTGPDNREVRTYWMARITEARILRMRGDYEGARKITEAAQKNSKDKFTLIDASIGLGEAWMGMNPPSVREAIKAFEKALSEGGNSRKISAVCHLHLCLAHLEENQLSQAMEHYKLWEMMEPSVENAFIADLAETVRERIRSTFPPFHRSKEDLLSHGSSKVHLDALRRWMAETALAARGNDPTRAAAHLDITRDSLQTWLRHRDYATEVEEV